MIDTNEEIPKRILDQKGTPFPPRETLGDRCKTLSRKTRVVIAAIIALIAGFAAILANLQTIKDYFRTIPSPPIVPPIVVEISNSSEVPIDVVSRGDFFLWLPGPEAYHTIGKYELHSFDSNTPDSGIITVDPSSKIRVLAHVMNQDYYGRVLERADCDIGFMIRKVKGGLMTTDNMPFTKEAIDKYCTTVDIGSTKN